MAFRMTARVIQVLRKINVNGYASEERVTLRAVASEDAKEWSTEEVPEATIEIVTNKPEQFGKLKVGRLVGVVLVHGGQ